MGLKDADLRACRYLVSYAEYCIINLLDNVMDDSEEDPEYSAVTVNNLIICLIKANELLRNECSISVKDYIITDANYSECDYEKFERKRKKSLNII